MSLSTMEQIAPENLRVVGVPLAIDQIKEFFENKNLFFLVEYKNSKIKGNMFLTYLSNLDLPFEVVLEGASIEEKFELLRIYMETRNQSASDVLRLTVAELLLRYKGIDPTGWIQRPILNPAEMKQFIDLHPELMNKWDTFFSSLMIFILKCFSVINDEIKVEEQFPILNDPQYVGGNVVQLFSIPGFLDMFFSVPCKIEIFYFKPQFEDLMFKGKNLFHYFSCDENNFLNLINGLMTEKITPEMFDNFMKAKV